jgi:competence protein ComEC
MLKNPSAAFLTSALFIGLFSWINVKLLAAFLSMVLFSGCLLGESPAPSAGGGDCASMPDTGARDGCYAEKAKADLDIRVCDSISDSAARGRCVTNVNMELMLRQLTTTISQPRTPTTTAATATTAPRPPSSSTTDTTQTTATTGSTTSSTSTTAPKTPTTLPAARAYFFDVGYGESSLFLGRNGSVLTNCGSGSPDLKRLLYGLDLKKVNYLVMTQPSEEDYFGCSDIMEWMFIDRVLESGQAAFSNKHAYVRFEGVAQLHSHKYAARGYNFTVGEATFQVLAPARTSPEGGDVAANSMVVRIMYGNTRILMMGDCESSCDRNIAGDVSADIIFLPNHGPNKGVSPAFIDRVKPKAAIVAAGPEMGDNPSRETMDRLKKDKVPVYYVGRNGTIEVQLSQAGYAIKAFGGPQKSGI